MIQLKMVKGSDLAEGVRAEMQLQASTARFVIGRDPAAHWPIPDRTLAISARHCELAAAPGGLVLRDLSTNGTFVNGSPTRLVGEHPLCDGDRIELGPYTIVVQSGLPRPAAVPAKPLAAPATAASPPARSASVEATTPLRGGDPAAMLGSAAPARPGLTEILRAAPPLVDESQEVTKIRMAPKPAARPDRPAGATPMPAVAAQTPAQTPAQAPAQAPAQMPAQTPAPPPAPPAAVPVAVPVAVRAGVPPAAVADPVLAQLATGLGLPPDALAGHSPAQAAAQVAALARAGVVALRALMDQQAQARRQIGSRAPALGAMREVNALRRAATPEAALVALLAPGADAAEAAAPLQRAADELAAHQARLLAAFRGAATRLGEEIAPGSLQTALGVAATSAAPSVQHQAQLWALYTQVWQSLGLAPGQPWAQGFEEAALMHLAAAYDESAR